MANGLKMRTSAMGTAIVGGSQAYVVFERVERFARTKTGWGHDTTTTLGLTIAHEIGHLLLRTSMHTVTGLMSAAWSPAEAQLAASDRLLFTSREAALIRKGLAGKHVAVSTFVERPVHPHGQQRLVVRHHLVHQKTLAISRGGVADLCCDISSNLARNSDVGTPGLNVAPAATATLINVSSGARKYSSRVSPRHCGSVPPLVEIRQLSPGFGYVVT